jgi:hypothetical protein
MRIVRMIGDIDISPPIRDFSWKDSRRNTKNIAMKRLRA